MGKLKYEFRVSIKVMFEHFIFLQPHLKWSLFSSFTFVCDCRSLSLALSLSFSSIKSLLLRKWTTKVDHKSDQFFRVGPPSDLCVWAASQSCSSPFLYSVSHHLSPLNVSLPCPLIGCSLVTPYLHLLAQNRHFWLYWYFQSGIIFF